MRILIPLDNIGGGGIARVGTELAHALARRIGPGDGLLVLGGDGVRAPRPGLARLADTYRAGGRITQTLHDQLSVIGPARHADIVHSIDAKAPLLTATPTSLTVHDVVFLDHPDWFPRSVVAYKRAALAASLRRHPALVVCVSHHTLERLRVHHPDVTRHSRVAVIHSGITARSSAAPRVVAAREYFLTVSAIEPRKNHLGLLAAFQRARRAGLTLDWKIVGRPQYDAAPILEALTAAEGVELVGRVDDDALERLYDGARFVATPSWEEGFGLPPLEAMRRGVPVISSTGSALDETVADGGRRIDPADTEAWAEALLALESDDAEVMRLSRTGLEQACRFRWDDAADGYLREFRMVARRRASPPEHAAA
jgi:glycosyltransferase involved in cell wall biosynthesis